MIEAGKSDASLAYMALLSTAFEVQWLIQTKVVLQTDRDRDRLQTRISRMDKTDLGASVDVTLKTFRQYFTPLLYPGTPPLDYQR